ncbi:hypothetical protein [Paracidobacterium acidisoli]|uniref:SMODS-associating 2TM beta-strand rich effector domain-containing protein n=1 Tax=Paracidobacterium acidisoli TaxID=2303751 RepID=A0A372IRM9_9BACT|nr:hypothetical protein [Paracidobacterium acidisoli]MBT9330478.1 hypothetical protein [Paracidobacterium acidisoli]
MERFERMNNIYRLFVATAVSAIAALVLDRLQQIFRQRSVLWIVVLALVAVVLFFLNQVFEGLLEHSLAFRRLVAGNEFIEGYWFDISVDKTHRAVHHGSFITIWWESGRFVINGIEFDPNGNRICTFRSTSSAYLDRVLTFSYESHTETYNLAIETGIDQLQFDNPPQSYSGFYFDYTKTVDFRVQGSRIDQSVLEEQKHFRDVAAKQTFIMARIAETQQRLDAI